MESVFPQAGAVPGMSWGSRAVLLTLALLVGTAGLGGHALANPGQAPIPARSSSAIAVDAGPSVGAVTPGPGVADVGSNSDSNTTIVVQLRENGDARWSVTTYFNLSTTNETEAFRDLAAQFKAGEASALGLEAFRRARDDASSVTGREMLIRDESRSVAPDSTVENGTGWLRLSFTWTNFARVEDSRLVVGDAFQTANGVWLRGLAADQRLVMHAPEDWGVLTANTTVNEATLIWTGPRSLDQNSLSATFTGSRYSVFQTIATYWWILPVVLALLVGLVAAYLLVRSGSTIEVPGSVPDDVLGGLRSNGGTTAKHNGTAEDTTGEDPATANGAVTGGASDEDVDLDLLSDEERVERLLERNGGRMKQANIVKETGWSNAKVSQLLSSMDQDGRIDKLRIGRENLISFPDEDLTDVEE